MRRAELGKLEAVCNQKAAQCRHAWTIKGRHGTILSRYRPLRNDD